MLYLYLGVVVRGAAEAAIFKEKRRVKLAVILTIIDKYINMNEVINLIG